MNFSPCNISHGATVCACSVPGLTEALRIVGYLRQAFGWGMLIGTTAAGFSGVTGGNGHDTKSRIFGQYAAEGYLSGLHPAGVEPEICGFEPDALSIRLAQVCGYTGQ